MKLRHINHKSNDMTGLTKASKMSDYETGLILLIEFFNSHCNSKRCVHLIIESDQLNE